MCWQNWGWHCSRFSLGWQHFISFHCKLPAGLSRGYVDFQTCGTDKQTDRKTDVFVELIRNKKPFSLYIFMI
jgi:hypothetical protein